MNLPLGFTDSAADALPLHLIARADFAAWRATLAPGTAAGVTALGY